MIESPELNKNVNPANTEFDLFEAVRVLWKKRRIIFGASVAGLVLSAAISQAIPNTYTATATIIPVDSSTDRLSSSLSSLASLNPFLPQGGLNLKGTVADKFVAILRSRTVTERVISEQHLLPLLFARRWDSKRATWKPPLPWMPAKPPTLQDAAQKIKKLLHADPDPKTGLISINVDFRDPKTAELVANQYIIELNNLLQNNTLTNAKRSREFLSEQVSQVKKDLSGLEAALKAFQETHQLVSLDAQAEASIQAYAALRSQLTTKEMELKLQSASAPEEDVQLLGIKREIEELKTKISDLKNGQSDGLISIKDAPRLEVRFAQLKRDILIKQKVFEMLTQQFEMAKLDEAKETLSFQILDRAVAPEKPSKPQRGMIVLLGMLVCAFLSAVAVMWREISPKEA